MSLFTFENVLELKFSVVSSKEHTVQITYHEYMDRVTTYIQTLFVC